MFRRSSVISCLVFVGSCTATPPATAPTPRASPAPAGPCSTSPNVESGARAPFTLPATVADARVEELARLEELVDLWWAAKKEHERLDHVDVHAAFEAARRRAPSCSDEACYVELVRKTLCSLGDGHLRLEPEWWQEQKRYRSDFRLVSTSDGVVVETPGASLAKGERVVRLDGKPIAEALGEVCERPGSTPAQRLENGLAALSSRTVFGDAAAPRVRLSVRGNDERERDVSVEFRPVETKPATTPSCVEGRLLDAKRHIGLLAVKSFWCDGKAGVFHEQTRNAARTLGRVEHLIVDLRDNGGGMDEPARFIAGALLRERTEWMRFQHHRPYAEAAQKFFRDYVEPTNDPAFSGWKRAKLRVLIGPGCFSTCDTFASALRGSKQIEFVGQNSAGGVGNPTLFRLPYSGLSVSIPVTLYALPGREDDVLIEGRGVSPDRSVVPTRDDVMKGRDAALEAALGGIGEPR